MNPAVMQLLQKLLGSAKSARLPWERAPGAPTFLPHNLRPMGSPTFLPGNATTGATAVAGGAYLGSESHRGSPPSFSPDTMAQFDELTRRGAYDNSQGPQAGQEGAGMERVMQPEPAWQPSEPAGVPVMQESPEVVMPQRSRPEMVVQNDARNAPAARAMPADPPMPPKRPANLGAQGQYQSNNRQVNEAGTVNWGDSDSAADFFRADEEMRRMRGLLG